MALRIKKTYPSASNLSGHEAWMSLLPLMLAQISKTVGQSKVFCVVSIYHASSKLFLVPV